MPCSTAKAIIYPKANKVALADLEFNEPEPTDVLVKSVITSVTPGLERMQLTGKSTTRRMIKFPVVPGSELIGQVQWTGDFVQGIEPGELVYVSKATGWKTGNAIYGCLAESVLTHFEHVLPLGENDISRSILMGTLGYCLSGLDKITLNKESEILILGLGSVGLILSDYLYHQGHRAIDAVESFSIRGSVSSARTIATDMSDFSTEFENKYDLIVETTGRLLLMEEAIKLLKPQGDILLMGSYDIAKYDYRLIQDKEPRLCISSQTQTRDLLEAKHILNDADFPAEKYITHVFNYQEFNPGLEAALNAADAIKTIFTWQN